SASKVSISAYAWPAGISYRSYGPGTRPRPQVHFATCGGSSSASGNGRPYTEADSRPARGVTYAPAVGTSTGLSAGFFSQARRPPYQIATQSPARSATTNRWPVEARAPQSPYRFVPGPPFGCR